MPNPRRAEDQPAGAPGGTAVLAFYAALGWRDTDSLSLYRTLDPEVAERERRQKADWAARLAAAADPDAAD